MPYFSVQFSLTVNIFNQPPAVLDPKSKNWSLGSVLGSICFNESTLDPLDVIHLGCMFFFAVRYAAYNEPLIASNVSNLCMLMQALSVFWLLFPG